jgi:hypothetical protein
VVRKCAKLRARLVAQVAGTKSQSGLAVADKAQSAVNLVKVINALNKISDMLKARPGRARRRAPAAAAALQARRQAREPAPGPADCADAPAGPPQILSTACHL